MDGVGDESQTVRPKPRDKFDKHERGGDDQNDEKLVGSSMAVIMIVRFLF